MIRIEFNIDMPNSCDACPLQDEEFNYCHGHFPAQAWELEDNHVQEYKKPTWCPLIEVKKSCNECMLGAPSEICWQTQCINYSFKKYKEEQWLNLIEECLKDLREKYEIKRDN